MSRPTGIALGIGAAAAAALLALGLSGVGIMPSYLGAWLFLLSLPLGALPIVMGCELLGLGETSLTATLRGLVAVMPLAALLAIPVLLGAGELYPSLGHAKGGLPGWWMTTGFFTLRAVVFLALWTALAVVFRRPEGDASPGRRTIDARRPLWAGLGLGSHAVMATLAADDWAQLVEPSFNSSAFGPTFIAVQCSIALSLAVAMAPTGMAPTGMAPTGMAPTGRDRAANPNAATALAAMLAAWGFLAFTQYLVVWSANLPREVIWYQHRAAGMGLAAEYSAGILCALALVALLPEALARRAGLVAWVAAALAAMHGLEMLWLVTPAFRLAFRLTPADLVAMAAMAGLGIGLALLVGERTEPGRVDRGRA